MNDKTVKIRLVGDLPGIWVADHFAGAEPDPVIVDLFGTHTLPLPYTGLMDAETVLAKQVELAAHSTPHVRVELA